MRSSMRLGPLGDAAVSLADRILNANSLLASLRPKNIHGGACVLLNSQFSSFLSHNNSLLSAITQLHTHIRAHMMQSYRTSNCRAGTGRR